jgi:hypothetical protein
MVPSHVKVTVPPPAIAARKLDSVQLVTVPPAHARGCGHNDDAAPTIRTAAN